MTTDDKDPDFGTEPGDAGKDRPRQFVDRDDDLSPGLIDSDYTTDFPGDPIDDTDNAPDPGYAAFASELEDPLADWPTPDTPLNELPEVRNRPVNTDSESGIGTASGTGNGTANGTGNGTAGGAGSMPGPGWSTSRAESEALDDRQADAQNDKLNATGNDTDRNTEHDAEKALQHHEREEPGSDFAVFDDLDDDEEISAEEFAPMPPEDMLFSDDDSPGTEPPVDSVDTDAVPDFSEPEAEIEPVAAQSAVEEAPPELTDVAAAAEAVTATDDLPELHEDDEDDDSREANYDDEFVDDFLNDLDPPEEDDDRFRGYAEPPDAEDPYDDGSSFNVSRDVSPNISPDFSTDISTPPAGSIAASLAGRAGIEPAAATSIEMAYPSDESDTAEDLGQEPSVTQPRSESIAAMQQDNEKPDRSLPLGMIAVVAVALALLAVGGYGVIQQRGEMQAEIRELQSRLATAPSPEEAEAEQERQRQIALENESLGAELEALTAENSALAEQLETLETQLAERSAQIAAAEAEAKRAAEEAAAQAAARKTAAKPVATSPATSSKATARGPWFVNFGSYAQREVADRWAGRLSVDDGQVVVQTATAAGKTLYRVRVVGLGTQDAAERIATTLERQYQLPRLWVGKN